MISVVKTMPLSVQVDVHPLYQKMCILCIVNLQLNVNTLFHQ